MLGHLDSPDVDTQYHSPPDHHCSDADDPRRLGCSLIVTDLFRNSFAIDFLVPGELLEVFDISSSRSTTPKLRLFYQTEALLLNGGGSGRHRGDVGGSSRSVVEAPSRRRVWGAMTGNASTLFGAERGAARYHR
jgi:hypothetical protein